MAESRGRLFRLRLRRGVGRLTALAVVAFATLLVPSGAIGGEGAAMAEGESARISIVYDNNGVKGPGLRSAWGFACAVDFKGHRILFDTGGDGGTLLSNMRTMGIDPASIDAVVISHIHSDHAGGLDELLKSRKGIEVYVPSSFPARLKGSISKSGSIPVDVSKPREIFDGVFTTGEMGGGVREQGLVLKTGGGAVLITGCAHPGIVEMVSRASEVCGATPYAAVGGYHMSRMGETRVKRVVEEMRSLGLEEVAPCHCTGKRAISLFKGSFGSGFREAIVGSVFDLPAGKQ